MDDKNRAIEDFLKNLRVGVNHASLYFNDHPVFVRTVNELLLKLDEIFKVYDPFIIGVANDYLVIDGVKWQNIKSYSELAHIFHQRKVKNIYIKKGVTANELAQLLFTISLSPKEVIARSAKGAGIFVSNDPRVYLEGLDYFDFLREGGEGEKEVWGQLLSQAAHNSAGREFSEFTDNFSRIIERFRGRDFIDKPSFKDNVQDFLDVVRKQDKVKFARCAKELAKVILKDKSLAHDEKAGQFHDFFRDVDVLDLSNTLWDEIINNEQFDFLTFKLFSQLVGRERAGIVAASFAEHMPKDDILHNNAQIARRMKELFRMPQDNSMISVYRKALDRFLADTSDDARGAVQIDRESSYVSYRGILLNLLMFESRPNMLKPTLDKIVAEWDRIVAAGDIKYIRNILEVIDKKKCLEPSLDKVFAEDQKKIFDFIEHKVLEEDNLDYFDLYYATAARNTVSKDLYIARIFQKGKVNENILKLFFKFFDHDINDFLLRITQARRNSALMRKIVDSCKNIDSVLSVRILEHIFTFADTQLQIDIIHAAKKINELSHYAEGFLFSVLPKVNMYLRKEAVSALFFRSEARMRVAERLLIIDNFFGFKNQLLLENIKIVEDMGMQEAQPYLQRLTETISLFKLPVARRAQQVLMKKDKGHGNI